MSNFNNIEEVRIEINRLRAIKEVQEETLIEQYNAVKDFFSPIINLGGLVKNVIVNRLKNNVWIDMASWLFNEIRNRNVFPGKINTIIDFISSLFTKKS